MPSEHVDRAAASRFVAALGAAMASANYPVTPVRGTMEAASKAYDLDHQFLTLPNYIQVGSQSGEGLYVANPDFNLRYDQSFPLAKLVARAPSGMIEPREGLVELERIRNPHKRFPVWITVLGYAVQSVGLALILQPTTWSLIGAATLGLLVGALSVVGRRVEAVGYMLPTICAFLVALIVFTFHNRRHVGIDSLRAMAAPLATFLPGAAITLAVIELATHPRGVGCEPTRRRIHADRPAGLRNPHRGADRGHRRFQPRHHAPEPARPVGAVLRGAGVRHRHLAELRSADEVPAVDGRDAVHAGQWIGNALLGTHSTAVFTATLISMMSIAVGVQTGLLLWRAAIQPTSAPDRRAFHD